jgi:hypothetical protein
MRLLEKAPPPRRRKRPRGGRRAFLVVVVVVAVGVIALLVIGPVRRSLNSTQPDTTLPVIDTGTVVTDTTVVDTTTSDPVSAHLTSGGAQARTVAEILKSAPMWTRLFGVARSPGRSVVVTAVTTGRGETVYVMGDCADASEIDLFTADVSAKAALADPRVTYRTGEADGRMHFTVRGSRLEDESALNADWTASLARFPADTSTAWTEARRLAQSAGVSVAHTPLGTSRGSSAVRHTARLEVRGSSAAVLTFLSSIGSSRTVFEIERLGLRLVSGRGHAVVELSTAVLSGGG